MAIEEKSYNDLLVELEVNIEVLREKYESDDASEIVPMIMNCRAIVDYTLELERKILRHKCDI